MAKIIMKPIGSAMQIATSPTAPRNDELRQRREEIKQGWGEKYQARVHAKNKLTVWERLERLGGKIYPIGTLVQTGSEDKEAPAAGVVTAWVQIENRWCMVIANDNTVASGSWWPKTPEKIIRAQEIALKLKLPVVYLVDCSGLYLPEQAKSFPGQHGAGRIFKMNSLLSNAGVPQIAGVFGDCIAGGGYMPIISDRVYMTESAYMVIAGAALIQGAKSQNLSSLDIGGASVHVHISNCADARVPDDETCLLRIREEIARLPSSAASYYRGDAFASKPAHMPAELESIIPANAAESYDIREVVARLIDDSLFWEVLPGTSHEVLTGIAKISGLYVGIAANVQGLLPHPQNPDQKRPGGILYKEGVAKLAMFSRACDADGIPIIWLQDVSGFDVGVEAEKQGLLGYGSSLIYANSVNQTPMMTVLLRKASGAGYYAMAGLPYDPVIQLSTRHTRLAVMEGKTLALGAFNTKPSEIEAMRVLADKIESDMNPFKAAGQMDTDEVIQLSEMRDYLECLVESCYQAGHRRIKNPRIWALHDLEVLAQSSLRGAHFPCATKQSMDCHGATAPRNDEIMNDEHGIRAPLEGLLYLRASPKEQLFVNEGDMIQPGQTVALIEVMKCFHPIKYEGKKPARAVKITARDNQAIKTGDLIVVLEM